jgi:hypothetical protein
MQVPSTQGFHILSRGVHWNVAARIQATVHAVEMPPQM